MTTAVKPNTAHLIKVTGVVQGIGFRPFVHRLATRHGLSGWVRNASGDVQIHVEGMGEDLEAFELDLAGRVPLPPLARFETVACMGTVPIGFQGFSILESSTEPERRQPISPDVATCAACLGELADPRDRRFRYPFITCTDCGPRFTVIEAMPYDRERTSMRAFEQCETCAAEYHRPSDRRFHSETNSCAVCGPTLWYEPGGATGDEALDAAAGLLREGKILALRGLGGFHLAVDATDEVAVARLRERKHREAKPLAVMVGSLDEAASLVHMDEPACEWLARPERPIVLLPTRDDGPVARSVAPSLDVLGVMLAYTPLHHLLLEAVQRPLVMTSGNRSEEPIAIGNQEAKVRLGAIADGFLLHDREIVARYDDSVVRLVEGTPVFLRRARGFAPLPVALPVASPVPLLAVGPHLKNTFTLVHERTAYPSQHIGDLENLETLEHFRAALERMRVLFRIEPEVAVRDLHPGYLSSRVAEGLGLARVITVQHHHAHVAAVLAEHGMEGPAIGLAYDGTGLGDDGLVWGAEVLVADLLGYRRLAHMRYAPMPGGDLAARTPWRCLAGYASLSPESATLRPTGDHIGAEEHRVALRQIERGINAPFASSMGRLFDAAAAVLDVRHVSSYEGQAAMELESLARGDTAHPLPFPVVEQGDGWILDPVPLLLELAARKATGEPVSQLAAAFHQSIAEASTEVVSRIRQRSGLDVVVLSGGTFQNALLFQRLRAQLLWRGFEVLAPMRLGPNDGAISLGQAAVAAAQLAQQP